MPHSPVTAGTARIPVGQVGPEGEVQYKAIIRMEDEHFSILHGEYTLNGDLVATFLFYMPLSGLQDELDYARQ